MMSWEETLNCIFAQKWQEMEALGQCDGLGGSQYRRALQDWKREGCPTPVASWLPEWCRRDDFTQAAVSMGG